MNARHAIPLALLLASAAAAPLQAASFDCARAQSPDERAVCADAELSALDSEMGGLWYAYSRIPLLMGANGVRQDDARAFLEARGKCGGDTACLTALYRQRIATLKGQIADFLKSMPPR